MTRGEAVKRLAALRESAAELNEAAATHSLSLEREKGAEALSTLIGAPTDAQRKDNPLVCPVCGV